MSTNFIANEIHTAFDARRVKTPELKNVDIFVNGLVGWVKNHRPRLGYYRQRAKRIEALEPEIQKLTDGQIREEVEKLKQEARLGNLDLKHFAGTKKNRRTDLKRAEELMNRAFAMIRESSVRTLGKRPYLVQLMGAMAMVDGFVIEMATGEGKTLTAALASSVLAWSGRPVHVITVNDYLVARDAAWNKPLFDFVGITVGHVVHETSSQQRLTAYRSDVVYITSKELVADFLRDQIMTGALRSSTQTVVGMMLNQGIRSRLLVPGLFRAIADEADSLLIDEAVTPLIISNSPNDEANAERYKRADALSRHLVSGRDFTIDKTVRSVDLTARGQARLEELAAADTGGFWAGKRRREELVTQALVARNCFHLDEHYLITPDGKIVIIDEFTGRVMADRSWRHGLHQAIEVKEQQKVTSDKENLARISFQKFFRQYPSMAGMTGTCWEARDELWQIYGRALMRIPTNRPLKRKLLRTRMFRTSTAKWDAVVERVIQIHETGAPILIGTRSVWASEEVSRRLNEKGLPHRVLNARQDAEEANIISEAGQIGKITVATNMAGRGTDIILGRGVVELGGLHVIATEPHSSGRIDRQLFGRAGRQGDPGIAQMFASLEDDVFNRNARFVRKLWPFVGTTRLIKWAQWKAEQLARFNRKQVLRADEWMDQSLPF